MSDENYATPDWLKSKNDRRAPADEEAATDTVSPLSVRMQFSPEAGATALDPSIEIWAARRPSSGIVVADALMQSRRALSRSVSSNRVLVAIQRSLSPDAELTPTFLCKICFENTSNYERFLVAACGNYDHGVCTECASAYFKGRISEGRLSELVCPVGVAEHGCHAAQAIAKHQEVEYRNTEGAWEPATVVEVAYGGDSPAPFYTVALANGHEKSTVSERLRLPAVTASAAELEVLLVKDQGALEQYRLLSKKLTDPTLSECPSCKQLCSPAAENMPIVSCACGAAFCAYHAWGHKKESEERGTVRESDICASFERQMLIEARANDSSFGIKQCPCGECGAATIKNGGW
jgi:hypothetical protein